MVKRGKSSLREGLACGNAGLGCRDAGAELCPGTYHEQDKNAKGFQQCSCPRLTWVLELHGCSRLVCLSKGLQCFQKDPFGRRTQKHK